MTRGHAAFSTRLCSRRARRGVALILVLMVTVVMLIVMGSLLDVLAMEAHAGRSSAESDSALTAAYAGVDAQILAIENFYILGVGGGQPPNAGQQVYQNQSGGTTNTGYDAAITGSYSDNAKGQKYYLIQSTGFVSDSTTDATLLSRQVTALVQEVLLGQFPQATNSEHSNTGGIVYYTSGQQYNGLVYSGGTMHIVYTPGDPAIFTNGFETTNRPSWYDTATGSTKPPLPGTAAWNAVFGRGATYQTGVQVNLPGLDQNLVVFSEAFAGNSSDNTLQSYQSATNGLADGVYLNGAMPPGGSNVPLNSGIFVQGNTQMSASATDTSETFKFLPGAGDPTFPMTTVVVNFTTDQTTVTEQGEPSTVYNGVTSGTPTGSSTGNGAIFVNGALEVLDGATIEGQYNIALPDPPTSGTQEMTVDGSIKYQFELNPSDPATDELALWSNDIILNTLDTNPTIDAMLLTGYVNECTVGKCADGSFYNVDCSSTGCRGPMGTITLFGSLLENIRGKLGELNSQDQLAGGFLRDATYDARLGANPPPFTPTTNLYTTVAVQDDGTP